ncbi:hypothetical protein D9M72_620400 [compost metagenome]
MLLRQLQVVLGLGRLVAGGGLAVSPVGLLQGGADAGDFLAGEDAGNVQQHVGSPLDGNKVPMIFICIAALQAPFGKSTKKLWVKCKYCKSDAYEKRT